MKEMIVLLVMLVFPSVSMAGFFSDYDDSKLVEFKKKVVLFQGAPLEKKSQYLDDAASINAEIQENCKNIKPSATYYINQCYPAYHFTSSALAESYLYYSKLLIEAGKKDEAKSVLKSVIIAFTGNRFKSNVKEAEFLLADLAKAPEQTQMVNIETLRLQIELEKTKIELEKLKAQNKAAGQ